MYEVSSNSHEFFWNYVLLKVVPLFLDHPIHVLLKHHREVGIFLDKLSTFNYKQKARTYACFYEHFFIAFSQNKITKLVGPLCQYEVSNSNQLNTCSYKVRSFEISPPCPIICWMKGNHLLLLHH